MGNKKITSLLMFSGGLDSAWALVRLLTDTDDEALVHHVNLLNDAKRYEPEREAARNIVEYCRENYRPFSYTETTIDHRRLLAHGLDLLSVAMEAGAVSASYKLATGKDVSRWILGISLADDTVPDVRFLQAERICKYNHQGENPPELFLFKKVSQQEIISQIPLEVYQMAWSCRAPVYDEETPKPCGKCRTCLRICDLTHPDLVSAEERNQV